MKRLLVSATLLSLVLLPPAASSGSKPPSPAVYDGLYYVTAPATEDPYDYRVVLSHDGKAVPPKGNDPDEPTQPGFYRRTVKYPFERVTFTGQRLTFRTASVHKVSYSFEGSLGSKREPEFDEPIPIFRGSLSEFHKGKLHVKRQFTFNHAVEY